jgi:DNA repair exonuclease SbcCD nuclease subunit
MFKKIACFTDIHFGLKSNSATHNQDCEEFVDWFIAEAKKEGCDTGIFLGDWHHNRNTLNMVTMVTSIRCLEKLGAAFENFYFFPGNHDLYYKDKRDIHSVDWGRHIPGVTIVNEITTIGDTTMVPWLVNEEWKKMEKLNAKKLAMERIINDVNTSEQKRKSSIVTLEKTIVQINQLKPRTTYED